MIRSTPALVALASLLFVTGCDKKAPDAPAAGATNTATNGASKAAPAAAKAQDPVALPALEVDDAVKALLTDGNPGVVMRVRLGAWAELAPALSGVAARVDNPMLTTGASRLAEGGPIAVFEAIVPPDALPARPDLGSVDTSRPLWLSLRMKGSGQSWGLFRLGVSVVSLYEPLIGWEITALVPSKDPGALGRELQQFGLRTTAVGSHLRATYLSPADLLRGEDLPKLTPVEPAPWRVTPALARFLSEDAPVSAFVRAEDLRVLTALDGLSDAVRALRYATPENRMQMLARGFSTAMYAFLNAPLSISEFEDHALLLGGDLKAEGAFVDVVSTRTAFGRGVQTAAARAASLPTFSEAALPAAKALVDVSYSYDIAAVAPLYAPFFEATRGPRTDLSKNHMRDLAGRMRSGGLFNYLTLLANSPLQLPALLSQRPPSDLLGDVRPTAARLRVLEAPAGDRPGVAALAIAFSGDHEKLEALLPMLREQLPPALREALVTEITPSAGGGVLRASVGVKAAFGPDAPLDPGAMRVGVGLEHLSAANRDVKIISGLGDAALTMAHDPATSFIRLGVSKTPLAPLDATAYTFDPAAPADVCVDVVSQEIVDAFDSMARLAPDQRSTALDPVLVVADACAKKVPSPHWALLPHRLSVWLDVVSSSDDAAKSAEKACAAGDDAGCNAKGYFDMIGETAAPR